MQGHAQGEGEDAENLQSSSNPDNATLSPAMVQISVHTADVKQVLRVFSLEVPAREKDDLTEEPIVVKLRKVSHTKSTEPGRLTESYCRRVEQATMGFDIPLRCFVSLLSCHVPRMFCKAIMKGTITATDLLVARRVTTQCFKKKPSIAFSHIAVIIVGIPFHCCPLSALS